jgi:hypothetical protein
MVKIRSVLMDIMESRVDPASLTRGDAGVQESRMLIVSALNFFEELSIAVLNKNADEHRLKQFFAAITSQSFAKLEDWIRHERKIDNEPGYYVEFEALVTRWKKG